MRLTQKLIITTVFFCGTVNIVEQSSDDEKELQKEKKHGDKNVVH